MYRRGCISPYAVWMWVSKERNLYAVLPCPPHSKQSKAVGFMGRIWETDPKIHHRSRGISEISEGAECAHSPENLIRCLFASSDVETPRLTLCWFDSCAICASLFGQRSGAGRSMAPGHSELWGALVGELRGLAWPGGLCEHPQERPRQETSSWMTGPGPFLQGGCCSHVLRARRRIKVWAMRSLSGPVPSLLLQNASGWTILFYELQGF